MVNQIKTNVARRVDKLNESDAAAHGYIAQKPASRNTNSKDNPVIDDVIAHLANAHENRRARQVTEWERMFRTSVQRAA